MKISKKNRALGRHLAAYANVSDPDEIAIELQRRDDKIKALRAQVKQLRAPTCPRCDGTGRYELTTTGYGDVQITSTEECRPCGARRESRKRDYTGKDDWF